MQSYINLILGFLIMLVLALNMRQCIRNEAKECNNRGGYYLSGNCLNVDTD